MLIAHGPLGYLLARGLRRYWKTDHLSVRTVRWLYTAAIVGGIFPDIDLVYFYFINASVSHRQLLTHSFIVYAVFLGIGYIVSRWSSWRTAGWGMMLFSMGCLSHIVADMFAGMAAGLAPLSTQVFGLQSLSVVANGWFGQNSFLINYLTEAGIIFATILMVVKRKRAWLIGLGGVSVAFIVGLIYINHHIFRPDGNYYYSDQDHDGVVAAQDRDSDGDGLVNMIDDDIDNDGEDNSLEFYKETYATTGALYDYTNGNFIEVPLRIGLVNDRVLLERLFGNVGIFFATEMAHDYTVRPDGYTLYPTNDQFADLPNNWAVWLNHTQHLLPSNSRLNEFDILFFQSGHVGVLVRVDGVDSVLEADSSHWQVATLPLAQVKQREGGLIAVGRVLAKPFIKRY